MRTSQLYLFLAFSFIPCFVSAQWAQDLSNMFEISNVKAIEASTAHLYVLSEDEGMAVFRIKSDSLQWLYTSSGMQRRGNYLDSDIRFGYLYGDNRRLTVLEPTSVLGVFSSTYLPAIPLGVARLGDKLFVALNELGLGELSLSDPDTFDNEPEIIQNGVIGRASVIDIASSTIANQLFVLTSDDRIHLFKMEDGELSHTSTVNLDKSVHQLFIQEDQIWASSIIGEIFSITTKGVERKLGTVNGIVSEILQIGDNVLVHTKDNKLWHSKSGDTFEVWQNESSAGNFITQNYETTWISIFDKISPLIPSESISESSPRNQHSSDFKLKEIDDIILTFPKPLVLGLELEYGDINDINFTFRSNASNAMIKKQGFFWQPTSNQIGIHPFTIIATNSNGKIDSINFSVDIKTFNAPPRFSPVRGSTIAVNDSYELTFNAIDPENLSSTLIRYLGVDLPEGSTLNEKTGLFSWTPTERQLGEQTFRIVATDEQGTAASIDVTFNVVNISRGE